MNSRVAIESVDPAAPARTVHEETAEVFGVRVRIRVRSRTGKPGACLEVALVDGNERCSVDVPDEDEARRLIPVTILVFCESVLRRMRERATANGLPC